MRLRGVYRLTYVALVAAFVVIVVVAVALVNGGGGESPSKWDQKYDLELRQAFASGEPDESSYELAFRYFVTSFVSYRLPGGSQVRAPGAPSRHGIVADQMEGFTRFAPLAASWLSGGRPRVVKTLDGKEVDLLELIRQGVVNGTNPESTGTGVKLLT